VQDAHGRLPVEGEEDIGLAGRWHDLDVRIVAHHHGTHGEDVRANGRDDEDPLSGASTGPPALSEYAVEPVGVATMRPSALYSLSREPSTRT